MRIKSSLIVIYLLTLTQFLNAQTRKNKIQVSGYFSSSLSLGTNGDGSSISPSTTFGYFINNHVLVKGEILLLASFNNSNGELSIDWRFGSGIGVKYYFGETKLQPLVGLDTYYRTFNNRHFLYVTLEPGISYFLRDNIAIEATLPLEYVRNRYEIIRPPYSPSSRTSNAFSSQLSIGFQIYLR